MAKQWIRGTSEGQFEVTDQGVIQVRENANWRLATDEEGAEIRAQHESVSTPSKGEVWGTCAASTG